MSLDLKNRFSTDKINFGISPVFSILLLIVPLLVTAISYYLFINNFSFFYKYFVAERFHVESLALHSFIINTILAGYLAIVLWGKFKNKTLTTFFVLLSIGCLFVALEEISWGQWLFFFKTPEAIRELNLQREFNFHNIKSIFILSEFLKPIFGILGIILIFKSSRNRIFDSLRSPFSLTTFFITIITFSVINFYNFFNSKYVFLVRKAYVSESGIFGFAYMYTEVIELFIGISLLYYLWHCIKRNN